LAAPYLFSNRVVGRNTHELGLYLGAVPLVLIVWLIMRWGELRGLRSLASAAGLFSVFVLVLAFGEYGPLQQVQSHLPLVKCFRIPARYVVVFELAASVLAALGFLLLVRANRDERRRRHAAQAFTAEGAAKQYMPLVSLGNCLPLWILAAVSLATAALGVALCDESRIASIYLVLVGPVLFVAAAVLTYWSARGSSVALVGVILLAAVDLGAYGLSYSVYPYCPKMEDYLSRIPTPPESDNNRVLGSIYRYDRPGLRTGDQIVLRGWSRADGYAGLEPLQSLDYAMLPALRVAGVGWVRHGPTTKDICGLTPADDTWSRTLKPLPRVRLVNRVVASNDPGKDIANIDIDKEALSGVALALMPGEPGTASLVEDDPGRLRVRTESQTAQLLVVAESYHPGWKAAVGGAPAQVYRVNGDFMGCLVGPGTQSVDFQFQPASLRTGRLVSYLGLGFLPFCLIGVLRPAARGGRTTRGARERGRPDPGSCDIFKPEETRR